MARAKPLKIHRILSAHPDDCGETLCGIPVTWMRDTNKHLVGIISSKTHKRILAVWDKDIRHFDCANCRNIWGNITKG